MLIRVVNWRKFQHYSDRNPPWIKLHRSLLKNRDWHALSSDASRLLVELWLLASESEDGTVSATTDDLAWNLRKPSADSTALALQCLEENGFIEIEDPDEHLRAITLLSSRRRSAPPETEAEGEAEKVDEKNSLDLDSKEQNPENKRAHEDELSESKVRESKVLDPETEALVKMGRLLTGTFEFRDHPRSTSVPKEPDDQSRMIVEFLAPYFPDPRPGAGVSAAVGQWLGRIEKVRIVAAIREMQRGQWKTEAGEECSWSDLSKDSQRKAIISVMNGMMNPGRRREA